MLSRITISYKISDARAMTKEKQFDGLGLDSEINEVSIFDSYTIDAHVAKKDLNRAAHILANPILEAFSISKVVAPTKFDWLIEVGFLPGVTDNVGMTTKETIEDLLKKKFSSREGVYSSQ